MLPGFRAIRLSGLFKPSAATSWAAFLLMVVDGIAMFLNGGYFYSPMTFCVVGTWVILAMLIIVRSNDEVWFTRRAYSAAVPMALFWIWIGVSVSWSIASDLTWVEFNRTGGYLAALLIGIAVGGHRTSRIIGAWTFFFMVSAASLYSLAAKALPAVVDNLENLSRTSVPLGYANALGILIAMAIPLALYFPIAMRFHIFLRMFAVMMAPLLLISLFFTLSRGAILALLFGLILYFSVSRLRFRSFGMLVLALVPATLVAWWSSGQDALMGDKVDLSDRMISAVDLLAFLVITTLSVAAVYTGTLAIGRIVSIPRKVSRLFGFAILAVLFFTVLVSSFSYLSSKPSISQWLDEEYESFTAFQLEGPSDATRLLRINSSIRWQLWQEAIASWEENRLAGSGAQTFPVIHMLKRQVGMPFVKQPHGLPFQLLTELGMIGFSLFALFIMATLSFSFWSLYRTRNKLDQGFAAALASLIVIYLVHTSFDWDWNMLALTLPYFFFTGILVGLPASHGGETDSEGNLFPESKPRGIAENSPLETGDMPIS